MPLKIHHHRVLFRVKLSGGKDKISLPIPLNIHHHGVLFCVYHSGGKGVLILFCSRGKKKYQLTMPLKIHRQWELLPNHSGVSTKLIRGCPEKQKAMLCFTRVL